MRVRLGLVPIILGFWCPSFGATNQVPGPVFKEDPRFPLQSVFAGTNHAMMYGAREDARIFVTWGGPNREWLLNWDLKTGELKSQKQVVRLAERMQVPELSPSGKYFFQPSVDKTSGTTTITYLDSQTGQPGKTATFNLSNFLTHKVTGSSQDERHLVQKYGGGSVLSGGKLQMWPTKGLPPLRGMQTIANDYRYSVATDDKQSRLYLVDVDKFKVALDMPLPSLGEYANQPYLADVSGDGRTLVIRGSGNVLNVIDVPGKKVVKSLAGHADEIVSFRIANDGTHACSIAKDNTLRFWDMKGGSELAKHAVPWGSRLGPAQDLIWVQLVHSGVQSFTPAGAPVGTLRTLPSPRALISRSGEFMVDVQQEATNHSLTFWKLNPPALIGEHPLDLPAEALWISPDGHYAMSRRGVDIWVFNVPENKELWAGKTTGGSAIGLLPEAKGVLVSDGAWLRAIPFGSSDALWKIDVSRRSNAKSFNFCAGGRLLCFSAQVPCVVDLATGASTMGAGFPDTGPGAGIEDAFVSDDGKTIVTLWPDKREVSWWTAEGALKKTYTFDPGIRLALNGRLSVDSDAGRAFVALDDRIVTITPDGNSSGYFPFIQNFPSFIRLFGESVLLQNGDWAMTLKVAPAKAK